MNPAVSATAIGSFAPDSAARSVATRRRNGVNLKVANTAAASVEPTIAPSSSAVIHDRSKKK
jgi:hypothetical protein